MINAASEEDAVEVGRSIARNNLLKCAIHGEDPNWGRVLSAIGTTKAAFEPDQLNVAINGVWVCKNGSVGEDRELVDMRYREVHIVADLAAGTETATIWTNDLTADYVHENSAYSSRAPTSTPRCPRPRSSSRRCPGSPGTTARSSSSSSAATPW